jgi:hypothetical protein
MLATSTARGVRAPFPLFPTQGQLGLAMLAACLVLALAAGTARTSDDPIAPREREWYVYDDNAKYLQGESVQAIRDTPGALTSTAPPPPGGKPVLHPFLSANTVSSNHEGKLRRLLEESTCLTDYLARVRKAGLRVETHTPDQLWQVRSGDNVIAEISDVPSVLADDEGLLADLPVCRRFLTLTTPTSEEWARLRPILMKSGNLTAFLRALVASGLRVERRVSSTNCEFIYEALIRFSSQSPADRLKIATHGRCQQAWLSITISPPPYRFYEYAYEYGVSLSQQLQVPVPDMRAAAEKLFAQLAGRSCIQSTQDLPPYLPTTEYCDQHRAAPKVSRAFYEVLRRVDRPLFRHPTGPSTWVAVVYDTEQRRAITVVEGGAAECGPPAGPD